MILQQAIELPQAIKLLSEGKTDMLNQFISRAGKPFSASLTLDDMGKVNFEFASREG